MAGALAASLHLRTVAPCFLLSTPSSPSSLCSPSPSVPLCAPHAWHSRRAGLTQRLPATSCTPAVARLAVPAVAAAADEDDGGLFLYEEELGLQDDDEADANAEGQNVASTGANLMERTFRLLGNKEKKELRAYAHQLGNDVCIHQVGKWGLTTNCITAISDALEANELVKIRVLDNLDEELKDTASQLEAKTGAQIVGKMGRTFLLYRPSMRKLKAAQAAEEKAYKYQKRKNLLASRTKSSRSIPGASRGMK